MSILPYSLTSINEHISKRPSKNSSISKLNRERSIRRIIQGHFNEKSQQSTKRIFNDDEINIQLSKEMKQIQILLSQIYPQLEEIKRKNNQRPIKEILFDLEQKIKIKNNLLTQISNQNKDLKSANRKAFRFSDSHNDSYFNPQKQQNTFKLAQQLKNQRQELIKVKDEHFLKKNKLQQIKNQVMKIQAEYVEKCKKTKQKPMTYEMFKCLNEQKKKELNIDLKNEDRKRNKRQTLKQMLKSNSFQTLPNKNRGQKNLKQIVNHKKIAQQALKTARKKYNQEISEFYAKLQFLREEDLALVQTLRDKEVELYTLESKFNESRKQILRNRVSNQNIIRSQNTLRYKDDSQDSEQMMRRTRKNLKFLSPDQI